MVDSPALELRTFGGLRMLRDGVESAPLPDRPAVLLGALVAARGRIVGRAALVDLVWPERPPASATNQLHRYIGELRRALEPGLSIREAGTLIERHVDGYRLRPDRIDVDLDRFDRLVAEARGAADARDDARAVASLLQALEPAAMPAFSDLAALSPSPDVAAVETARIAAAVQLASAAQGVTDPGPAVRVVARIAAQDPLNEVLQAAYIRLLVAADRASEGLTHYAAVADHLRETLGSDPGAALRSAHHAALSPEPRAGSVSAMWVSNLPSANPAFVDPPGLEGRLGHLQQGSVASGTITVLAGGGGVGKTTLAVHLARTLERGSGASSVFIDFRGFDPEQAPLSPEAAIRVALDQLGLDHAGATPAAEERQLHEFVVDHPVVAVLDSARDVEQVRPLLACLSGSTVVVTTRSLMRTLVIREGARLLQLDRWDDSAAYALLAERLGIDTSASPDPSLVSIARACAGLPLALAIAAARCAAVRPSVWPAIAKDLTDAAHALDVLAAEESDDLRTVFANSLLALDDDTVAVFRRIALVPTASADRYALAAVAGVDLRTAGAAVRRLVDSSLLGEGDGSFTMHDLVRSYALELLGPKERDAAEARAVSYVALVARSAWLLTGRPPVGRPGEALVPSHVLPTLTDMADAARWGRRNIEWIKALGAIAPRLDLHREAVTTWLDLRPWHRQWTAPATALAEVAELDLRAMKVEDAAILAEVRSSHGFMADEADLRDESLPLFESALELFRSIGDHGGISKTYRNLANGAIRQRRYEDADAYLSKSEEHAAISGNGSLIDSAAGTRFDLLGELEQWDRIVELAPDLVRISRQRSPGDLTNVLERYSWALLELGEPSRALPLAREAVTLTGAAWTAAALPLSTVALAAAQLGRHDEASEAIDRFAKIIAGVDIDFDAYFVHTGVVIRDRFRRAGEIVDRLVD